MKLFVRGD